MVKIKSKTRLQSALPSSLAERVGKMQRKKRRMRNDTRIPKMKSASLRADTSTETMMRRIEYIKMSMTACRGDAKSAG